MKKFISINIAALTAAVLSAVSTSANITFTLGNNPQEDEENILVPGDSTGLQVFGSTQSGISVGFESSQSLSIAQSNGQARVAASDGLLNNLMISVPNGTFTDFILNPFDGSGTATISIVANEPGGGTQTFPFAYDLGNGQNFLTILATDGETISSLSITAPEGFTDLRQPRISGAATTSTGVPDAGSSLVLLATGVGALLAAKPFRSKA